MSLSKNRLWSKGLKGATITGNNIPPILRSIFLTLKVAPMRIENNFKRH